MNIKFSFVFIALGFIFGAMVILVIPNVLAHGWNNDPYKVYGCVSNVTQALRVVSSNTACGALESSINFPGSLAQLPSFTCPGCDLSYSSVLKGKDVSGAWLKGAILSYGDYEGTMFKDAQFSEVIADGANFRNADMTGVSFYYSGLTGALGMTTTILTSATWVHTNCPDGTGSDENGGTCVGHLVP